MRFHPVREHWQPVLRVAQAHPTRVRDPTYRRDVLDRAHGRDASLLP